MRTSFEMVALINCLEIVHTLRQRGYVEKFQVFGCIIMGEEGLVYHIFICWGSSEGAILHVGI
jgi:hypothetical protein